MLRFGIIFTRDLRRVIAINAIQEEGVLTQCGSNRAGRLYGAKITSASKQWSVLIASTTTELNAHYNSNPIVLGNFW